MEENVTQKRLLIGALLRIPYMVAAEAAERGLSATGYGDVRAAHLNVFQPLFERPEGARITDLAAWAHITKPSMVYLVDYLEAHGYVERTADPVDGRAQRVRLTAQGEKVVQTVRGLGHQIEVDWEGRIGTTQLEQLKEILRDLIASLRASGEDAR
jgi:DNA-binding MarR family transcriptional regulator